MDVIVIPAYNEAENIPRLLGDLRTVPHVWEHGRILIVDDGSSDGTAAVIAGHAGGMPVEILVQSPNQGAGRAFDRGFRRALELTGDNGRVITLEADNTSDLDALGPMLDAAADADLVLASVHVSGGRLVAARHRRVLSRGAARVIRAGGGVDARTVSSFFRIYRAGLLRRGYERHGDRLIQEPGFACKAELLIKLSALGGRVVEIPVELDASRRGGESKLRTLPTLAGYARMMTRVALARGRSAP